ncbi:MAG TPA: asparagine synthase B [Anaerolineales bacterium]|nr:asparagine synthase B [Anaerolineales bacterium]
MCGIAGALEGNSHQDVHQMVMQIQHRGPDGVGVVPTEAATLGHTRLAIVDVNRGHQPLKLGEAWIAFNGEIYNHMTLRKMRLPGQDFRTHTDTETILGLYQRYGPRFVELLNGMFALAISWRGELFLARDPLGIKPLYYGYKNGGGLHFASEVKALALVTDDIHEFPAGHWYHSRRGWHRYYRVEDTLHDELPQVQTDHDALQAIRSSLRSAVGKRMMSDVPVGVSLSGGLDSSIVSMIASQDNPGLHSFVVGVAGGEDLDASRRMAEVLGTQHHEYIYTEREMLEVLPEVIYYLESFDPALVRSAIPNYVLARMASDHVKVMLTGEGADELYAGYAYLQRYEEAQDLQGELVHITEALHNTNLQRGDRMSMAHGLEARVPFLDVESVSLALSIPAEWKLQTDGRPAKDLLRRAYEGLLPDEIVYRPKMKFSKGAGSSDVLAERAEDDVSDADYRLEKERLREEWDYPLPNKEALVYYRMLRDHYQDEWIMPNMGRSRSL